MKNKTIWIGGIIGGVVGLIITFTPFASLFGYIYAPFLEIFGQTQFRFFLYWLLSIIIPVIVGILIGALIGSSIKKRTNKKISVLFLILIFILINTLSTMALEWQEGSIHQHTGYSTKFGYDKIPFTGDDCWQEGLPWGPYVGYTVEELKEDALDLDLSWLAFSDHSYCLNTDEFNVVKEDCQASQDPDFSCLWGEELSVDEDVDDYEPLMCSDFSPITRTAHLGGYGIPNFIEQSHAGYRCPDSPGAQEGINSINNAGGISVINHPYSHNLGIEFCDFESIDVVSGETAIEIWNGEFDSYDQIAKDAWLNKLQENEKVFIFGGTDSHSHASKVNYNVVGIDSLTHSDLEEGLDLGRSTVSNNGYVRIKAKTNTQSEWTEMGGELDANTNEILTVRVRHNVENSCTLTVRRSPIGSYFEYFYTYYISGFDEFDIDYPLTETGDYYFRAECIGSGGDYRTYTNPIWVDVLNPDCECTNWQSGSCGGGSCSDEERRYTRTCTPSGCDDESKCEYDPDCSSQGNQTTNCNETGYEFCIEYEYGDCDVSVALNLYENVNNVQWGAVNDNWDPYVIGEYIIGWKDVDAEQMYYDCDGYNNCYYGGCDCEEIPDESTMVTITAPGTAHHEEVLGYDDTPNWACWTWFFAFDPNYGEDNPVYVLRCFDDNDCSSGYICDKSGSWNQWACVSKYPDGHSCTSDSQCQSNYCDNDGVGLVDDEWCFTPYNTYFDGQEPTYCEYSTNNGIIDCDEREVSDELNKCIGISYYEEECSNTCNYQDNTSIFECTDTGCSCSQPLCDGLTTGSNITTCESEETYFADKCTSTASGEDREDNICRSSEFTSGCTADSECNGVEAGTGNCTADCNYITDIQISNCTVLDVENATYVLISDISNSSISNCMSITANNIIFDCQGYIIDGDDSADYGIRIDGASGSEILNTAIKNCILTGWDTNAILIDNADNSSMDNITIFDVVDQGVTLSLVEYWTITNSNISANDGTLDNPNEAIILTNADYTTLENITIEGGTDGIRVFGGLKPSINNINISSLLRMPINFAAYDKVDSCNGRFINNFYEGKPILLFNETVNLQSWNNNFSEIIMCNADNSILNNITFDNADSVGGIIFTDCDNCNLTNSNIDRAGYGILFRGDDGDNCYIYGNTFSETADSGYVIYTSSVNNPDYWRIYNNTIYNNHLASNTPRIYIGQGANNFEVYDNEFHDFSDVVLQFDSTASDNIVYNNLFNSTQDTGSDEIIRDYPGGNFFNTSQQSGTRIYGDGPEIGGNYYTNSSGTGYSDTCTDTNHDGFCDTNYTGEGNAIDYLPLSDEYSSAILDLFNLTKLYSNNTERIFEFFIQNLNESSLGNVAWKLETGENNITSQFNSTLQSNETIFVYAYHNYSAGGNYTVTATAYSNGISDSETIEISV